jgi:hypothetical protein
MASKIKVDQIQTADGTGTIALQNQLSGMTGASMPTGSVIQTVNEFHRDGDTTTTSTSFVDTGCTKSITPTSSSNKILVNVSGFFWNQTAGTGGGLTIYRNGSNIHPASSSGYFARIYPISGGGIQHHTSFSYLDSPNTTSSVEYKVYMKMIWGSGTLQFGSNNNEGFNITLQEIVG